MSKEVDIETTPTYFACETLGLNPYRWQETVLAWFEDSVGKRLKASVCTPNGAGKDSIIIAALALWWISIHRRGRVVITSKDARQIDEQTMPALIRHRATFADWKWIEREVETPTGGKIIAFTTDDEKRCEGFHRETGKDGKPSNDGPLLLIANEAKSIDEGIFEAFDRCTYDALLYASSPGQMAGRFYDSQMLDLGFRKMKVGLRDCPHVPQERIDDIIRTYGKDSAFARSTLDGEFMEASNEQRFDREGLNALKKQAENHDRCAIGSLQQGSPTSSVNLFREPSGWLWVEQTPEPGGEYLIACDPNTCEQGEGAKDRDNTACCVIRKTHLDDMAVEHPDHVVACLHWPDGVKWDSDVLAKRMKLLSEWYGNCMAVVEANNFGSALIKELQKEKVRLWQRTRVDDVNPNKTVKLMGWLTTERTREHWVQACSKAVRMNEDSEGNKSISLRCAYKPAVDEFHTFIFSPDGRGEAQSGTHDDWCACVGIGLTVRCFDRIPLTKNARLHPQMAAAQGGGWD